MTGLKFRGTLSQLRAVIGATAIAGDWRELLSGHHQFRTMDGAVMNWWSSTGTILFQGRPEAVRRLQQEISVVVAPDAAQRPVQRLPTPPD